MAITNPGFETAGAAPGEAAGWTLSTSASNEEVAAFDTVPQGREDFEEEWSGNESFQYDFGSGTSEVAAFDSTPQGVEDFEEEWSGNENFEFGLTGVAVAQFDTVLEDWEDFEEEWSSNEDFRFDWADVVAHGEAAAASFDSGTPEDYEDFEEEWFTAYYFDWSDLVSAAKVSAQEFGIAGLEKTLENFRDRFNLDIIPSLGGVGTPTPTDPTSRTRAYIEGAFVATLQVQIKRGGAYQDYGDPVTTTSTYVDLPEGVTDVRVETVAYTSGLPFASVLWGKMETM